MNEHLNNIRILADIIHSDYDIEEITYKRTRKLQDLIDQMQRELDWLTSDLLKEDRRR